MEAKYIYWQDKLAGKNPPVHEGEPQPGFYRKKQKGGPSIPVAIWEQDGQIVGLMGNKPLDTNGVIDVWTWVCQSPVTYEAYQHFIQTGSWPDEIAAPGIGHNSAPASDDPYEALLQEWKQEEEQAREILKQPIRTQEQADIAAAWTKRLSSIAKRAADLHRVEKQPHLDACRQVDDKWRDLKEAPRALSTDIKRALDSFLREQARLEEERQRKAREEAERKKREAEEAARSAQDDAEAERLRKEAEEAEREAKARNASAGRTGSKVALRKFVFAEITDYDALVNALKDREEMRELVQSLANRAAKSGVELPGMKIKEERRAA